jgi:hypothetical protein
MGPTTIESTTTTEQPTTGSVERAPGSDAIVTAEGLAASLGEDVKRVTLREVDWSALAQEGVLVKISVGLCNWATKMRLEDWGIVTESDEEAKAYERTCSFGYRNLLPRDVIDPIVGIGGQGRAAVERYSFPTPWGHFMPKRLYAAWRVENDKLMARFFEGKRDLEENWDTYVAAMDRDYLTVARRNYKLLQGQGIALSGDAEEYARLALERSKRRVQSKEQALAAFRWEWSTTGIGFADVASREAERALSRGDVLAADLATTQARTSPNRVADLMNELTGQIRGRVYDVVVDCLTALRKNGGKLPPASTGQMRNLVTEVSKMMFWPDAELEDRLATLNGLLGVPSESRSQEQIAGALTALGVEMRSYLLEIGKPVKRSGAEFGIPDDRRALAAARRRKPQAINLEPTPAVAIGAPAARTGRKSRASAPIADAAPTPTQSAPDAANVAA